MSAFKTDAPVRGSLNVGLLPSAGSSRTGRGVGARRGSGGGQAEAHSPSTESLDAFEEALHKKVDSEIEVLVDGLEACVALAKVRSKARPLNTPLLSSTLTK